MPVPIMQSRKAIPMREPAQEQVSNLDPAIAALIARVQAGSRPSIDEAKFVFGGEAYIRLTLADASPRRRRQPTGRDHQFNVRLRRDTLDFIYAQANERNIPVAQVIEEAADALKRLQRPQR